MDKSWITLADRTCAQFIKGLDGFLDFALLNKSIDAKIRCPCRKCKNSVSHKRKDVYEHVIIKGFLSTYTNWMYHGEEPWYRTKQKDDCLTHESTDATTVHELIHENLGIFHSESIMNDVGSSANMGHIGSEVDVDNVQFQNVDKDTERFFKLIKAAEVELNPGCKSFTLLSFVLELLHLKSLGQWSNNSFSLLLEKLKKAFPENDMFPSTYRDAWKIVKDLGLDYKKIHACPNDCMLYRNETEKDLSCKKCKEPRYKKVDGEIDESNERLHKIPQKVVRYFPLKRRLQRLYMSSKTAHLMRWHDEERTKDGIIRHPADSLVWKDFDDKHPDFASDCRNVRLGLAADGFNPFKTMNVSHSTWAVILIPYNLPPWKCMKQTSFFLSILIDGPRSPGNDIDVYLQPLVEELNELWDQGVQTYDAHSKQMFCLRAALLWTINDFPAYANLSGWSTKGKYACPYCNKNTRSHWLKHGRKFCYLGHRRFLPSDHKYRKARLAFDGTVETESKPVRLSGTEILEQLDGLTNNFGKVTLQPTKKKRKRGNTQNVSTLKQWYNWKKASVLNGLPYWSGNLLPYNIDIMHNEKNVLENILWTICNVKGKTKDNVNSRYDLQRMKIRKGLHPQKRGDKTYLPASCFTMSKQEKDIFLNVLKYVKVPDGYASNISRCVNLKDRTITGLKSHDCHILMQQLLPIAIRKVLPKHVNKVLMDLSDIFKQLYAKVHYTPEIEALQEHVSLTLCELEKIFPPSFFDIMEHLVIHLPEEALIAGPAQFRSMYPIERYLRTLKNYVRSRSRPEGSIAEGYLAEECMTFCSMYLGNAESKLTRYSRNSDLGKGSKLEVGRSLGKWKMVHLDDVSWLQTHRYVLANTESVNPFYSEHKRLLQNERPRVSNYERERIHNESFHKWFKSHVAQLEQSTTWRDMHKEVTYLAAGPSKWVRRCSGYVINGFRFHTQKTERRRKTQNSGVFVDASTNSYASTKDKNPIYANMIFYGVLTDIIELSYANDIKYVLFKCDWVDNNSGCKQDEYNFTLVNFKHLLYKQNRHTDEPFILASQAMQAWYVPDPLETDWHVAIKMTPRDYFNETLDSSTISSSTIDDPIAEIRRKGPTSSVELSSDDDVDWVRTECEGVIVDVPLLFVDTTSEIYSSGSDEDLPNAEDKSDEESVNDFNVDDEDDDDQFSSEDNSHDNDESSEDDGGQ